MPETPTFPILPVDRRFLARLDRFRTSVPQEQSQPADVGELDRRLRSAAGDTLGRYFRRTHFDSRLVTPTPGPSLYDRCPPRLRPGVVLFLAVAVLPFLAVLFAVVRSDLHPRLCRHRAPAPIDVLKGLAVTRQPLGFARLLIRNCVRRLTMP